MSGPIQLEPDYMSKEALLAEDGMCVSAGLPLRLREELDELKAARGRWEQARGRRERIDRLSAQIAEYAARIAELQKELDAAVREYDQVAAGAPA